MTVAGIGWLGLKPEAVIQDLRFAFLESVGPVRSTPTTTLRLTLWENVEPQPSYDGL